MVIASWECSIRFLTIPAVVDFVSRINFRFVSLLASLLLTSCEEETELERIKDLAPRGDAESQLELAHGLRCGRRTTRIQSRWPSGVERQPSRDMQVLNTILG